MKPVFADTFFFFAILNRADPLHQRAATISRNSRQLHITTDWVITELADGLSRIQDRERFMDLYRHIQLSPAIRVVRFAPVAGGGDYPLRFTTGQRLAAYRLCFLCGHA